MKLSPRHVGAGFAFLAAGLFAGLDVVVKYSHNHLDVRQMLFGRSLFGVLLALGLARLFRLPLLGRRRWGLVLTGAAGVAGVTCLMAAIARIPLFEALVLMYLFPVFSALVSPLLTRDRMGLAEWAMILTAFLGTTLVLWSGHLDGRLSPGHLLGLGAAVNYSLFLTLVRRYRADNNSLTPLFYVSLMGVLAGAGAVSGQAGLWPQSLPGWMGLLAIALLAGAAHLASNQSLGYLPSPVVGVVGMLEVILAGLFGLLLFGEPLGRLSLLGAGLVVVAALGLTLKGGSAGPGAAGH